MKTFEVGDTVQVIVPCAWIWDVGVVTRVVGPNVFVKFGEASYPLPFCRDSLRHSQQKLELGA